jgi:hypothetical protein
MKVAMRLVMCAAVGVGALLASGCGTVDKAQADIEQAINSLNHTQVSAVFVLEELEAKLKQEHQALAVEVRGLVEAAEAQAETHLKCGAAFVKNSIAQDLHNILLVDLLEKNAPSLAPELCGSNPEGFAVDVANAAQYPPPGLVVYGFNFPDESPAVRVLSGNVARPTETVVPEGYVDRQGSFDVDVDIDAFRLPDDSFKLVLEYPHTPRWEVGIKPHEVSPQDATLQALSVTFNTYGEEKKSEVLASVTIGNGLAKWAQSLSESREELNFPNPSTLTKIMKINGAPTAKILQQSELSVCGEAGEDWEWYFSMTLLGTMSNGEQFELAYPDLHLTNDVSCKHWFLPLPLPLFTPAPVPTPNPNPNPVPGPTPVPRPNPIPCIQSRKGTAGLPPTGALVQPSMRQCP